MRPELTRCQLIERSVHKRFRKELWTPFIHAVKRYELLSPGDHVAVCISGGKDSMLLALLMRLLQRYSDFPFDLTYLVMDPGYSPKHRQMIEENAETLGLPLTFFETNIFEVSGTLNKKPCYLCARMRRGHLYNKARELKCNKIALGHHLNDAVETTLMAMFYSSKLETIIPKSHSENFPEMELIRPMYCVKEESILNWCAHNDLHFINCACRFSEQAEHGLTDSKRLETKNLIRKLKQENPYIEDNIFRALHAVHIETFPGYKKDGTMHSFLENMPEKGDEK